MRGVEGLMGNTEMLEIKGLGDWFHMRVKEKYDNEGVHRT